MLSLRAVVARVGLALDQGRAQDRDARRALLDLAAERLAGAIAGDAGGERGGRVAGARGDVSAGLYAMSHRCWWGRCALGTLSAAVGALSRG